MPTPGVRLTVRNLYLTPIEGPFVWFVVELFIEYDPGPGTISFVDFSLYSY